MVELQEAAGAGGDGPPRGAVVGDVAHVAPVRAGHVGGDMEFGGATSASVRLAFPVLLVAEREAPGALRLVQHLAAGPGVDVISTRLTVRVCPARRTAGAAARRTS